MGRKNDKQDRNRKHPRCAYSNKVIGIKPAVLLEHAIEYVKKMGYYVSAKPWVGLFFFFFLMSSTLVSAGVDSSHVLYFDFSERSNVVMWFVIFVASCIVASIGFRIFAGFGLMILGFLMLFNDVNLVISILVIAGGGLVAISGR